eukprot:scaffold11801_cov23-Tisochrysis_lutea.AAC.1
MLDHQCLCKLSCLTASAYASFTACAHASSHPKPISAVSSQLTTSMHFVNKYVPPIPATITARLNGTNLERIFVLNVERKVENEEMMMVSGCSMITTMIGDRHRVPECGGMGMSTLLLHVRNQHGTIAMPMRSRYRTPRAVATHRCPSPTFLCVYVRPCLHQVCDRQGVITFTTWDMAALVGVSTAKLLGSKLESLLPPPYNSMHTKWLQDTPPTIPPNSCRAGVVVSLLNSSNVLVPVRLRVHSMEENNRTVHVVRVRVARYMRRCAFSSITCSAAWIWGQVLSWVYASLITAFPALMACTLLLGVHTGTQSVAQRDAGRQEGELHRGPQWQDLGCGARDLIAVWLACG